MNRPKKPRKRTRPKIRTSAYSHLWPELAYMPPLDHWPNRPALFDPERSQILGYLVAGYGCDIREAERIFQSARHAGVIRYNPKSRRWQGEKGGEP